MKTRFLFQGVELSEKSMQYVERRLSRIEKLIPAVSKLEVEVDRNKRGKFRVEIMVDIPKRKLFRSEETSDSVESATDAVIDGIERQITETKDREDSLGRRRARSVKKELTLDKNSRF